MPVSTRSTSLNYTVGHKDGIKKIWGSNIETYCFVFGSFITLEQVNYYVMILEYQGEINICKILRYVTCHFCLELWKAKCVIFCLLSCSLPMCNEPVFFQG